MPSPQPYQPTDRRPLATRGNPCIQRIASAMSRRGWNPNTISMYSCLFALGAAAALVATQHVEGWWERVMWLAAIAGVQGRLLCNLFDGMVAIERGVASPVGELYNEIPDRFSDAVILIAAGFAAGGVPWIGFSAAALALFVAYVRAIGASVGAGQIFCGPAAKQHRMFILTLACAAGIVVPSEWLILHEPSGFGIMGIALAVISIGCVVTVIRRVARIAAHLRNTGGND